MGSARTDEEAQMPWAVRLRRRHMGHGPWDRSAIWRFFSFFILKKIKISKIYFHFKKYQKYPPVAPHRATGAKCNFFFQIRNEVPGQKKCKGAYRPPSGDRGTHPYICLRPPFPPHLSPKIPPKIQKKNRGVRRREAAKHCRIQHL